MATEDSSKPVELQLKKLLDEIRSQRADLNSLREDVQGSAASVSSEVKRLKKEKDIKWNHVGNKIQFEFNSELEEHHTQAAWALDHGKFDYASEQLKEAQDKLKTRNKLIRIADTSEAGWETVRQYQSNPVASDSEDENRINRAEGRALKKQKTKLSKQKPRNATSTFVPARGPVVPGGVFGGGPAFSPGFQGPPFSSSGSFRAFRGDLSYKPFGSGFAGPGTCFSCGSRNHFRRDCPFNSGPRAGSSGQQSENKK